MSTRIDGSAGLQFMDDVIQLLSTNWKPSNVEKPTFSKVWNRKVTGLANNKSRDVLITLDTESPQIFSIQQRDGNDKPFWDWLHDVSLTIEIRTGTSETDALKITNEITRILKENVTLFINNGEYVQMLPGTIISQHEEFRNMFRYIMEVSALKYNP